MNTDEQVTGPINIGNPEEISVIELAALIVELSGSKSRLVFKPLPKDDPRQRRPDITLARDKLGWTPTTPLRDGLLKTIGSIDKSLSAAAMLKET
jgi:UDP-glucuronate decarboxylase